MINKDFWEKQEKTMKSLKFKLKNKRNFFKHVIKNIEFFNENIYNLIEIIKNKKDYNIL